MAIEKIREASLSSITKVWTKTVSDKINLLIDQADTLTARVVAVESAETEATLQSEIAALEIDWAYTHLYKTLSANTIFTFANDADAKTIIVRITNTVGNFTVVWPEGIDWGSAGEPVQRIGAVTDVYTFVKMNGTIDGAVRQ